MGFFSSNSKVLEASFNTVSVNTSIFNNIPSSYSKPYFFLMYTYSYSPRLRSFLQGGLEACCKHRPGPMVLPKWGLPCSSLGAKCHLGHSFNCESHIFRSMGVLFPFLLSPNISCCLFLQVVCEKRAWAGFVIQDCVRAITISCPEPGNFVWVLFTDRAEREHTRHMCHWHLTFCPHLEMATVCNAGGLVSLVFRALNK